MPSDATPSLSPTASPGPIARLALEDATVFHGKAFGHTAPRTVTGEACFNTSLSGYQEVLTDPSYRGQIVAMTCPLMGNYGVNTADLESGGVQCSGFIVRELSQRVSNHRAEQSLHHWLADQGVLGLTGIDTRALTRRLRSVGALRAALSSDDSLTDVQLIETARNAPSLTGRNLVSEVSRKTPLTWDQDLGAWAPLQGAVAAVNPRRRVVALDCGAKLNILRNLIDAGCDVTVLPWDTRPEAILEHQPEGLFVSNGPGDPSAVEPTTQHLRELIGRLPIFGICLGNQLLSRALGAETFKLKFGHRGGNQPVQNLGTGKVEITSQNHGFAVDLESLTRAGAEPTHVNLNDHTLEGFRHTDHPVFAVQYHPEASPGPHDSRYLFDCFTEMINTGRPPTAEEMDRAQRHRSRLVPVRT